MDSTINTAQISAQTEAAVTEVLNSAGLEAGDIFVIGCSTSEISGGIIGKNSNEKAGIAVASAALRILNERGIFLAVQSCEHLNRALVIEKRAAKAYALCEVSAVPSVNAGGACASAAFTLTENPVLVEHISAKAGLDIGDTEIGMHISFVQVPLRLKNNLIGNARVTALKSRPKLIGGERTRYTL